ncbi:hypothetical protein BX600DRAFT_440635 [Xylariales sp. PMI_506]|nr:hypothetical protein BX600DRAFT_440635 [Xylariales sp. PMI_506]
MLELLLQDRGANINVLDRKGRTALFYALDAGDKALEVAKLLHSYGIDVTLPDKWRRALLRYAAEADNLDMIKFLVPLDATVLVNLVKGSVGTIKAQNKRFIAAN